MKRALLALYRFLFVREVRLSDEWLRDIAAAEGAEAFAREMDGARVIVPRAGAGPRPRLASRYTDEPVR